MKKILFILVFLAALLSTALAQDNTRLAKWRIDTNIAGRMMADKKNCDTCKFSGWKNKEETNELKTALRKDLHIAGFNFRKKWKKARYAPEDEPRYAANHGLPQNSERAKVGGYTTKILRYRLPKKDRMKYGNPLQNSSMRPGRSYYSISSLIPFLLGPQKNKRPSFEYMKFIYLDFGAICPPPNPCVPDTPQ